MTNDEAESVEMSDFGLRHSLVISPSSLGIDGWIRRCSPMCCSVLLWAMLTPSAAHADDSASRLSFSRDIRPILSANCYFCHGPDEKHLEADLRLDQQEGVAHVFAGELAKNKAWQRITSKDPDQQMPPPDSHRKLKPAEIQLLKAWIEQGSAWEGHWAFVPPTRPVVPAVTGQTWVRNPIDAFILSKLERDGLTPSGPADPERLLRRIYFDLLGLPPTIEQLDSYLQDTRPDAYERAVDQLLSSKHFGERMALIWMDAARYGDSSVFHADGPRYMWPWRDWVINAYNENKSFDQFTLEQLAGDLLPDATNDQRIATGFNRNNATTDEGGAIAEEYRVEYAVDRVKTTSMVWMGLSLECAQCHNHKYDPITQEEYYRFFAFFNQSSDPGMQTRNGNQAPTVDVFDAAKRMEAAKLEQQLADLRRQRDERATAAEPEFVAWTVAASQNVGNVAPEPPDLALHFPLDDAQGDKAHEVVGENRQAAVRGTPAWAPGKLGGAFHGDGKNYLDAGQVADFERTEAFSYGAWLNPQGVASGAVLARMNNGKAFRGFDLLCSSGYVEVHIIHKWPENAIKVRTKTQLKADTWQHVFATYNGTSKAAGVAIYFDGKPQEWEIQQDGLTESIRTDVPLYLGSRNPDSRFKGDIDDVRVYRRDLSAVEVAAVAGSDPLAPILAIAADQRSAAQVQTLREHFLGTIDQPSRQLSKQINETSARLAADTKPITTVMVMKDEPQPRMTYILDRGNYASPLRDRPVEPGTLSILSPFPAGAAANRLGLAQWLIQPGHPLTARVAVNRYWHMLFGTGLVKTLEDFGAQGDPPSHPELLDWLAVDFVEHGWNIKRTLKQIVMSATYRQASRVTPEQLERDPENRLLSRGPRFRLAGEMIRDNALAAGGLLQPTIGGPSVKPYQPDGLWNEVSLNGNLRFAQDHGEKLYRRSLYTYWKRSAPAPSLTIFDAPSREKCTLRRSNTNTPLQALVTLNDPQFLEAARALAQQALTERQTLDDQIVWAFRTAAGVRPRPEVLTILTQAYQEELAVFQAEPPRAEKLLAIGESPRDTQLDLAHHAAMTIIASMILNLDETLTRG